MDKEIKEIKIKRINNKLCILIIYNDLTYIKHFLNNYEKHFLSSFLIDMFILYK